MPHNLFSRSNSTFDLYRSAFLFAFILLQCAPIFYSLLSGQFSLNVMSQADVNDASPNNTWQVTLLFIFLNSMIIAHFSNVSLRVILIALLPFCLMFLWMLLSVSWSYYPELSVRRISRFGIELTTITLLVLAIPGTSVLRILFRAFILIEFLDLVSIAVPALSFSPLGFSGIHLHKNSAGLFFYLAMPIFFLGIVNRSMTKFPLVAVSAFMVGLGLFAMTLSKSAFIVSIFSVIGVVLLRFSHLNRSLRIFLPMCFTLIVALATLVILTTGISETFNILFGDPTLTSRDRIWRYVLFIFERNPLHGAGYGAVWQVGPDVEATMRLAGNTWFPNEGHNGYIDILGQLGYVGLCFLIVFNIGIFLRMVRLLKMKRNGPLGGADYALYIFSGALIYNITESSFFRTGHGLWAMLMLTSVLCLRLAIDSKRESEKRRTAMSKIILS